VLALLVWCSLAPTAFAGEPPPIVRDEVQHLLTYLGGSGCEFFRNGEWHSAAEAKDHLAQKYDYLIKKDRVKTSEDFVRWGATMSSVSGKAYHVRCKGREPVPSVVWFSEELSRYREEIRGKQ